MKPSTLLRASLAVVMSFSGLSSARSEIKELTVTGTFERRENPDWFGLPYPIPYTMKIQFDTLAVDEEPADPGHGVYASEGLPCSLTFGDFVFASTTTEVQIYSGKDGFYGAIWDNDQAFVGPGGLIIDEYFLYASLLTHNSALWPTDEMRWMINGEQPHSSLSYTDLMGITAEGVPTTLQDNDPISFSLATVEVVPEPSACGMVMLGAMALASRRWRRNRA
jgi:hypothetical protein